MRILILSFFIFSCTFKEKTRIPASLPEQESPQINQKKEIVLLIEFKNIPGEIELKVVKGLIPGSKIELFDNYKSDYFQRLYRLSFMGDKNSQEETIQKLNSIKFVNRVERVYLFEELSIKINENSKSLTNDLFFPYLWGLKNSGQNALRDLDDIHFETLESASGADIGWSEKIKDQMKEEVIVGVLDSGVDYDHPDIKDNISKNLAECVKGAIPFKPKKDLDGNGYFGDCTGWNFTGKEVGGDNRPVDDVGHGTHVAGIIAAVSENKIGVSGLSNKIKILPIKVLKKEDSNTPGANGSLSDRVAKGILFAVNSNARVINLSLGWPIILDTKYLRMAFKVALENKITIVAASGNNNNNSPIFPCAYENVICVSSIGVDGKISNFSNYGGQVDVLAPGDNILSTYPTIKDPDLFFAKGYEIKNGTSQASPFVAASAAVLKSVYPGITENELKARLILSTKPTDFFGTEPEKYTSQGLINLEEAINLKEQPLVIPILKELNSISLYENNPTFVIPLKIKNIWKDATNVKIKLTSLTEKIHIDTRDFEFSEIKEGQVELIHLIGTLDDLSQDHNFDFQIEITQEEKTRIFKQNIKIVGTLGEKIKRVPILGLSETDIIKKDPYSFPKIKTVSDPLYLAKNPYYYTFEVIEGNATVKIFKKYEEAFKPVEPSLVIPGGLNVISVMLLDANYDGKLDFFIRTISLVKDLQIIQYSFFDETGKPLFGKYSHWSFTPETVVLDLNRINFLNFVPYKSETLGKVAIPLQILEGRIPGMDQNPDPFVNKDPRKSMHIYYFEPKLEGEKIVVKTRIVDNWKFLKSMRSRIGLSFNDSIFLLEVLPQNETDQKNGVSKFLISAGKNYFTNTYILKLKENFDVDIEKLDTDRIHFEGSYFFPITDLTNGSNFRNGLSIIGLYNDYTLRSSGLEDDKLSYTSVYKQTHQADSLAGAMATYKKGDRHFTFFQTKGHLKILIQEKGKEDIVLSRPIIRFSFIPGELFTETFFPIVSGESPALYVDTTQFSGNDVYILTINDQGRPVSPIKFNLRIPDNCKSLNPVPLEKFFSFTLLCQDNPPEKSWSLRFLEIK